MNKLTQLPKFKNISEEKIFWQEHDSTDYFNWSHAKRVSFPNLKPTTKTISLRLPKNLLNDIKTQANKEDVPYQSLMKILLDFGLKNLFKLNDPNKQKLKIHHAIPARSVATNRITMKLAAKSRKK